MKANSPFWIKVDIDGRGKRWRLAIKRRDEFEPNDIMIYFPEDDFEDHWDDDSYGKYEMVEIEKPKT